ncbi:bifunctional phosphopantothenoylcysteine decarboxylase/phosphopantothenate--cysteine ligase CoaBC [Aestuariivirga sp.]|uniref:bifunctional phosphopantothenoylcysteine decarboxylase/phosphopantothenate--cysteine ligase CoaBC n=1 Tax=Aestuariivirga sp. TaxID=2650926 RepID=UPI0039E4F93B
MTAMTRSILLIIGGGIAAYKSLELIRTLKKRGIGVTAIMTKSAGEFVTPLSVASLSGNKVYGDLFSLTDEVEMGHIELSRAADLLVVAPATADLLAKMATGLANDLASTALLATDKPVLAAPAMNVRMWQHAATQRNVRTLTNDGIRFVGPTDGEMACGEFGPGRMAEPEDIANAIEMLLHPAAKPLADKHVLVTAGPTREPIDPVRYISNHSSGKQGYAIATAAAKLGARVTLVSGPVSLPPPAGVTLIPAMTAQAMLTAVDAALPADIAIFTAAVADWRVVSVAGEKLKKNSDGTTPSLAFAENPDILRTIATRKDHRPRLVVGFAAETEKVIEHAQAKLARKGCDLIVANDVSAKGNVFGSDANTVHLVSARGVESWPRLSKDEVAMRLMTALAERL